MLGLALLAFIGVVQRGLPARPVTVRRRASGGAQPAAERPGSLSRLEREVSMAGSAAFDVHFRLRPVIAELAAELLSSRRGIDLERDPERAHAPRSATTSGSSSGPTGRSRPSVTARASTRRRSIAS